MLRTDIIDRERTQRCRRKRHMKLRLNDLEKTFEQPINTDTVIEQINEWLGEDMYFSHLEIDGVVVEDEVEEALDMKKDTAAEVAVITIAAKKFINDVLLSTEEYIQRAIPLIEQLAEQFYEQPTSNHWNDLNDLFGGLQWLNTMIGVVSDSTACPSDWQEVLATVEPMQEVVQDFEEALENSDTVLIADLLSYEIKPLFENLITQVTAIIDAEGERYELH